MKKIELEQKVRELESRIFDQHRSIRQLELFEQIGDEKLLKAYIKVDKYLKIINKIKKELL